MIENLQRESLKPIEEAEALARMMTEYDYSIEDLSRVMNKAKSTLSETLSLNRFPGVIKEEVRHAESTPSLTKSRAFLPKPGFTCLFRNFKRYKRASMPKTPPTTTFEAFSMNGLHLFGV